MQCNVPGVPTVLVPTTAGTGAEMTPNSILSDTEANLKKAIVSPFIFAKLAVVDPSAEIGDNCVIGAGAVVNKPIPDNSLAVGVPARVIERRKTPGPQ